MSAERQVQATRIRLEDALERMRAGKPLVLPSGYKWTKTGLAREAGINVNTLLRKNPDGSFVYAEANLALEQGPGGWVSRKATKRHLLLRIAELEATVLRLQRDLAGMART